MAQRHGPQPQGRIKILPTEQEAFKIRFPSKDVLSVELGTVEIQGKAKRLKPRSFEIFSYCAVFIKGDSWHVYIPVPMSRDKAGWKWLGKCLLRERIESVAVEGMQKLFHNIDPGEAAGEFPIE